MRFVHVHFKGDFHTEKVLEEKTFPSLPSARGRWWTDGQDLPDDLCPRLGAL